MRHNRLRVEDLMSTAVIALHENDNIGRAQLEMHLAGIRHIPVVDGGNHVVGILSNRDVARALATGETQAPVVGAMTRSVQTVKPWSLAADAANLMLEHKFGSLPVVGEDEQLVGIITETDFLAVASEALRGVRLGSTRLVEA